MKSSFDISPEDRALLTDIKLRPALYLGTESLTLLEHFLNGISYSRGEQGKSIIPAEFAEYLAERYNDKSVRNSFELVLFYETGERAAFDRYFHLLDSFLSQNGCEPIGAPAEGGRSGGYAPCDGVQIINFASLEPLALSYMDTFNAEPWNDSWTEKSAYDRLKDMFFTPGFYGLVLWHKGRPVCAAMGAFETYFDGEVFRIIELWTDNAHRRQGLARGLVRELLDILKSRGCKRAYLLTMRDKTTLGFYNSLGFFTDENMCMLTKDIN